MTVAWVPRLSPNFIKMGHDMDIANQICKFRSGIVIDGIKGDYTGEFEIESDLPHGRGILRAQNNTVFLGQFERGMFAEGKLLKLDSTNLLISLCY